MNIEKILRDTNLILKFLKENEEIAFSLFDYIDIDKKYFEIDTKYFYKKQWDFLYKTRWISAATNSLIGIIENNHIICCNEIEFFYCCQGFQHFPYFNLNQLFDGYSVSEVYESDFRLNVFKELAEYEKFCKLEKICIQEYYQQFFNNNCKKINFTNRDDFFLDYENVKNFEDDLEPNKFEQQSFMFCYETLRDNYKNKKTVQQYPEYSIIRRELFKPLVRLEQPRILDFEEEYVVSSINGIYWQD